VNKSQEGYLDDFEWMVENKEGSKEIRSWSCRKANVPGELRRRRDMLNNTHAPDLFPEVSGRQHQCPKATSRFKLWSYLVSV